MVRPPLELEQELRDHRHRGQSRDRVDGLLGYVLDVELEHAGDGDVDLEALKLQSTRRQGPIYNIYSRLGNARV